MVAATKSSSRHDARGSNIGFPLWAPIDSGRLRPYGLAVRPTGGNGMRLRACLLATSLLLVVSACSGGGGGGGDLGAATTTPATVADSTCNTAALKATE